MGDTSDELAVDNTVFDEEEEKEDNDNDNDDDRLWEFISGSACWTT